MTRGDDGDGGEGAMGVMGVMGVTGVTEKKFLRTDGTGRDRPTEGSTRGPPRPKNLVSKYVLIEKT